MAVLAAGYPPTSERPSLPVYYLKEEMFRFNCLALQRTFPVSVLDPLRIFGGIMYVPTQNNFEDFFFTICIPSPG